MSEGPRSDRLLRIVSGREELDEWRDEAARSAVQTVVPATRDRKDPGVWQSASELVVEVRVVGRAVGAVGQQHFCSDARPRRGGTVVQTDLVRLVQRRGQELAHGAADVGAEERAA